MFLQLICFASMLMSSTSSGVLKDLEERYTSWLSNYKASDPTYQAECESILRKGKGNWAQHGQDAILFSTFLSTGLSWGSVVSTSTVAPMTPCPWAIHFSLTGVLGGRGSVWNLILNTMPISSQSVLANWFQNASAIKVRLLHLFLKMDLLVWEAWKLIQIAQRYIRCLMVGQLLIYGI